MKILQNRTVFVILTFFKVGGAKPTLFMNGGQLQKIRNLCPTGTRFPRVSFTRLETIHLAEANTRVKWRQSLYTNLRNCLHIHCETFPGNTQQNKTFHAAISLENTDNDF